MAKAIARWERMPDGATLRVHIYMARRLRFRLWLGTRLICLAATIMQCDVHTESSLIEK